MTLVSWRVIVLGRAVLSSVFHAHLLRHCSYHLHGYLDGWHDLLAPLLDEHAILTHSTSAYQHVVYERHATMFTHLQTTHCCRWILTEAVIITLVSFFKCITMQLSILLIFWNSGEISLTSVSGISCNWNQSACLGQQKRGNWRRQWLHNIRWNHGVVIQVNTNLNAFALHYQLILVLVIELETIGVKFEVLLLPGLVKRPTQLQHISIDNTVCGAHCIQVPALQLHSLSSSHSHYNWR